MTKKGKEREEKGKGKKEKKGKKKGKRKRKGRKREKGKKKGREKGRIDKNLESSTEWEENCLFIFPSPENQQISFPVSLKGSNFLPIISKKIFCVPLTLLQYLNINHYFSIILSLQIEMINCFPASYNNQFSSLKVE